MVAFFALPADSGCSLGFHSPHKQLRSLRQPALLYLPACLPAALSVFEPRRFPDFDLSAARFLRAFAVCSRPPRENETRNETKRNETKRHEIMRADISGRHLSAIFESNK